MPGGDNPYVPERQLAHARSTVWDLLSFCHLFHPTESVIDEPLRSTNDTIRRDSSLHRPIKREVEDHTTSV